jgi:hypothetical protein
MLQGEAAGIDAAGRRARPRLVRQSTACGHYGPSTWKKVSWPPGYRPLLVTL